MTELPLDRVLAWRVRRQLLHRPAGTDALTVARRLCGVQAQIAGSADHAVAVRLTEPRRGETTAALAAARTWEKASWQKNFVTVDQVATMAEAVQIALDGAVLSREELTAAIVRHAKDDSLAEDVRSGWGAALKPLASRGCW